MGQNRAEILIEQYSKFSPMSANEARAMARKVFCDGAASRGEAEALYRACVLFDDNDLAWRHMTIELISDYLLGQGQEYGFLEFDAEDWLIALCNEDRSNEKLALFNFELVHAVLDAAQNASLHLGQFGLGLTLACMRGAEAQAILTPEVQPQAL